MKIYLNEKFKEICKEIVAENKTLEEWIQSESCDQFYNLPYAGGFESIDNAFCFSYYADNGKEYYFQITLEEVPEVLSGKLVYVDGVDVEEL